jgi:hypothetical protein
VKNIVFAILLLMAGSAFGQEVIEAGDTEISVVGLYAATNGDIKYTTANIQVRLGKYLTDRLLLGIGPAVAVATIEGEEETNLSAEAYCIFNFTVNKKITPYAKASYFQRSFDIEGDRKFTDYGYALAGLGVKYFFNDLVALDTTLAYGFSLIKESHDTMIQISSGVSFVF